MRTIGLCQRAFDMMCERALSRETQGSLLADKQFVQGYIADSYAQIQQFRLLVLHTAWAIDQYKDYRKVRKDIAAVKVADARAHHDVVQRAIQVHGALGVSQRDAPRRHVARRPSHGPGRRADRGAQGHRRPPGAARLPGERRPLAHRAPAEEGGRRPREAAPSSSSTRSATCEGTTDDRPRPPRAVARRPGPRHGGADRVRLRLRRHPERDLRDPPGRPARGAAHPAARPRRRPATTASSASGASSRRSTAPTSPTRRPSRSATTPRCSVAPST